MSETLVPYTDFDAQALGYRLHELVSRSKEQLAARHLLGLIDRYGVDVDTAVEKVHKGQGEDNPQHYAIIDEAGDVQGSASISEGLPLARTRFNLPSGITRRIPLAHIKYPYATHNVHAWTAATAPEETLAKAYDQLTQPFKVFYPELKGYVWYEHQRPWTVEPVKSPVHIHEAIAASGLRKIIEARFDDGESSRVTPPLATLYSHVISRYDSPHGQLRELKTGQLSRQTAFMQMHEQDNPNF